MVMESICIITSILKMIWVTSYGVELIANTIKHVITFSFATITIYQNHHYIRIYGRNKTWRNTAEIRCSRCQAFKQNSKQVDDAIYIRTLEGHCVRTLSVCRRLTPGKGLILSLTTTASVAPMKRQKDKQKTPSLNLNGLFMITQAHHSRVADN